MISTNSYMCVLPLIAIIILIIIIIINSYICRGAGLRAGAEALAAHEFCFVYTC